MKKILIIDDEPSIRNLIITLLTREGYQVLEAQNGEEAIEVYHKDNPDLIITDIVMPGKEGLETIRSIKEDDPDLPIIAISGGGLNDGSIYLNLARKLGALRTFTKPIENAELIKSVHEILT